MKGKILKTQKRFKGRNFQKLFTVSSKARNFKFQKAIQKPEYCVQDNFGVVRIVNAFTVVLAHGPQRVHVAGVVC